jgi:hypothetical protein
LKVFERSNGEKELRTDLFCTKKKVVGGKKKNLIRDEKIWESLLMKMRTKKWNSQWKKKHKEKKKVNFNFISLKVLKKIHNGIIIWTELARWTKISHL